jgi:DNA repair protein RecO (recombination protein O)
MLSFLVPGVYSKKAAIKPSLLQPMQAVELTFYFKPNSNLNKIKEIRSSFVPHRTENDFLKITMISFLTEVTQKCIHEEESNPEMFDFLIKTIVLLDSHSGSLANFPIIFLLEFSKYLGFYPHNNHTSKEEYFDLKEGRFSAFPESDFYTTPIHTSARLSELIDKPMRTFTEHKIPKAERQVLMQTLLSYYRIHVSGFRELNTLDILEKMYQNL